MNGFEQDVMDTLTAKGLRLIPQLGVSSYRLDFAALHPAIPNRYVLAIECDGSPYHSSATARDRDRLRQKHLEAMGWRFHRIWSLDWHDDRASEVARVIAAYDAAVAASADAIPPNGTSPAADGTAGTPHTSEARVRGPKPSIAYRDRIDDHPETEIRRLLEWIESDGRLRDDDEIIAEAVPALGYSRRGKAIEERLRRSVRAWRGSAPA
jgi:very-short-patch-repair endonuclease